jgi:putative CocE/NonD family hydrolase
MNVVLERGVWCTLRDGTRLATDVYRLEGDERRPVLLVRTPYDRLLLQGHTLDPLKLAEAGYAVCVQDVRGRFGSEGDYVPYMTESEDGYDAVQWAAEQPWSNGRVGMYGVSYLAQVQIQAAGQRPPALRAIAPIESPSGTTGGDRHRGGALSLGVVSSWSAGVALPELIRRMRKKPELRAHFPVMVDQLDNLDREVRKIPLLPFPPMEHDLGGNTDLFNDTVRGKYRQPMPRFEYEDIEVPALVIAGWYDIFLQPDIDHFLALRERAATDEARRLTRLVVAPWSHGRAEATVGQLDFGLRSSPFFIDLKEDLNALHLRWFDARLRDVDTGIDDEPPVRIFVMGENRWRYEQEWPPARAQPQRWFLDGAAMALSPATPPSGAEASVFRLDPEHPVRTHGGGLLMNGSYIKGPLDQLPTESHPDVLVFTSQVLSEPLEVIGRVSFHAWVATETPDSDVVARLCDVHPDGRSFNIVDGILRLSAREGISRVSAMTPGQPEAVTIDLWSTAHVFLPGHRLRLQVCASDFPRYDRCPGTGELSADAQRIVPQRNLLFHEPGRPSFLELPVIPR